MASMSDIAIRKVKYGSSRLTAARASEPTIFPTKIPSTRLAVVSDSKPIIEGIT